MNISGPIVTRLHKRFRALVGRRCTVLAVSSVSAPPLAYKGTQYGVCVVEFDDGTRGSFQSCAKLQIGDKCRIALRFGFENSDGLRLYIPKVVKDDSL